MSRDHRLRSIIKAAILLTGDKCKMPYRKDCKPRLMYVLISELGYIVKVNMFDSKGRLSGSLYNVFKKERMFNIEY